jgi:O-antigen/teichoic acid export membrane protein
VIHSALTSVTERLRSFAGAVSVRAATTNVVWVAGERVADIVFGMLINVLVINHLGPARYGPLAFALSVASIANIAVTLGTDEIVVAEVAARQEMSESVIGAALLARGVAGIALCPVVAAILLFQSNVPHFDSLLTLIALQPLATAFAMPPLWLRARMYAGRTLRLRLITLGFGAVSRVIGILLNCDVGFFAAILLLETIVLAASGWVVASPLGLRIRDLTLNRDEAFQLARRAFPLLLASLAAVTYMQLDMFFVFRVAGPTEGGIYSVASKLALLAYTIPVILYSALMPLALRGFHTDPAGAARRVTLLLSLAFWVSVALAIAMAAASNFAIGLLFSPNFGEAARLVRILAIAVPFSALGSGTTAWFVLRRAETGALSRTVVGLAASAIGCALLVPRFGSTGGAIATVTTFVIAGLLLTPFLGQIGREAFRMQMAAIFLRPSLLRDSIHRRS